MYLIYEYVISKMVCSVTAYLDNDYLETNLLKQTKTIDMAQKTTGFRWTVCALLFVATTINYLDRQVLSLLFPMLQEKFGWTNSQYANIASAFQFTYAICLLFAGRVIDKLGTKSGYSWAIIIWSIGAIIHAAALPIGEFMLTSLGIS